MKIQGDKLARICDLLSLVPSTPGIPSSVFIGMEDQGGKLNLRLTSPGVSASVTLGEALGIDKIVALDRRVLLPFLQKGGEYSIDFKDEQLVFRHGSRKADLKVLTPDWGYGNWKTKKPTPIKIPESMLELLQCIKLCATDDPVLPQMNGVYVEFSKGTYGCASNDIALGFGRSGAVKYAGSHIVFPLPMIDVIAKEKVEDVWIQDNCIGIDQDGVTIWGVAHTQAWTDFPKGKFQNLLKESRKLPQILSCSIQDLQGVISAFIGYLTNIPKQEWALHLDVKKSGVDSTAKTPYAEFKDRLKAKVQKEASFTLNLAVLAPILGFLSAKEGEVHIAANEALCHVKILDFEFLLAQRSK